MTLQVGALESWALQLQTHWQLERVSLHRLPGEYDLNLAVEGPVRAVLKVMRPDCERSLVEMQIAALEHIHRSAETRTTLPVPRVLPAANGSSVVKFQGEGGTPRLAWMCSWLEGNRWVDTRPCTWDLLGQLGRATGELDRALVSFEHAALDRPLKWDLQQPLWVRDALPLVTDGARRRWLEAVLQRFETDCSPQLKELPRQAVHNDVNDYNVLCRMDLEGRAEVTGIVDFGDMTRAPVICELAIAAAYALLGQERPVEAVAALLEGYVSVRSLEAAEVEMLWPLILTRLAVSALNAAQMQRERPNDPYVMVSQEPIEAFLCRLPQISEAYVRARLRRAAGLEPIVGAASLSVAIESAKAKGDWAPVFKDVDLAVAPVADLGVTGDEAPQDPLAPDIRQVDAAVAALTRPGVPVLGRYAEPRLLYAAPAFFRGDHPASDRRTVHLGIDVFLPAGTPVRAPLEGSVHSVEICAGPLDYGAVVTLRHDDGAVGPFFTLYGHLAHDVTRSLSPGQRVSAGEVIARLGAVEENGGWTPHLHFQLGLFEAPGSAWPGAADPDESTEWLALFPDPASLLGLPPGHATAPELSPQDLLAHRGRHTVSNLKLSYREPVTVVRGWRCLLFDDRGRTYLDAYNNVPHVGHAHPRITRAAQRQLRLVNTNTRYLQPAFETYVEALTRRLPEPLDVCFLLNSASEANDLAVRIARRASGGEDMIVSQAGYHGITNLALALSDYKFSGPGGAGPDPWVRVAPVPDTFRGPYKEADPCAGQKYADAVRRIVEEIQRAGRVLAGFISEPFPSVGGQIVPPVGYLESVYAHVRAAGGICIADEVQTGLGRLGRFQWGFEQQGVTPDIVVLGKPLGNGFPLAAVVTTAAVAETFADRMEFFSTFGGSTLSCVVGLEVLRILDEEDLAGNAAEVGEFLLAGLRELASTTPWIGDVRGLGFFLGVELVEANGTPATEQAAYVKNRLREKRILIGTDGPFDNVLKIRPPLCFGQADAEFLLTALSEIFGEAPLQA